jgi:tyrosyl-tRNA synthetase
VTSPEGDAETREEPATSPEGAAPGDAPAFDAGLSGLIPELRWRGMFHAASDGLEARFATNRPLTAYIGFDPSGPWLHIGHLVPIFGLIQLQRHGGRPIALMGGGTGMIGDPSGRSTERPLLSVEQIRANVESIRGQMERLLDFSGEKGAVLANNADWLEPVRLLEFLRDVGKHFTIPYMLAKDSVQKRLEVGLSFTEFSYMLIQSYDYQHLFRTLDCELQMGGADQWGNITAGLELIRRTTPGREDGAPHAYALAYPLLLNASGTKFGKSESGESVWLHPDGTTPYAFYQHWLNTDDRDVGTYLRWFTTLPPEQILGLDGAAVENPGRREAQRTLAGDITARVHGAEAAAQAEADSAALFGREPLRDPAILSRLHAGTRGFQVSPAVGLTAAAALADAGVLPSRGEARRLIQNGGLTINDTPITDPAAPLPEPIAGEWWDVRIGKRRREIGRLARP